MTFETRMIVAASILGLLGCTWLVALSSLGSVPRPWEIDDPFERQATMEYFGQQRILIAICQFGVSIAGIWLLAELGVWLLRYVDRKDREAQVQQERPTAPVIATSAVPMDEPAEEPVKTSARHEDRSPIRTARDEDRLRAKIQDDLEK